MTMDGPPNQFESQYPGTTWASMAMALGLRLYGPTGRYEARATFKTLKRRMGPLFDTRHQPNLAPFALWMYGRHAVPHAGAAAAADETIEVIVAAQRRDGDPPFFTAVVARIDPPLFVGLEAWRNIGPHRAAPFEHGSWAPERAKSILDAARIPLEALATAAEASALLHDSTVTATIPRVAQDEAEIAQLLDATTTVAARLAHRRKEIPKEPGEITQEQAWAAFASSAGWTFDPDRMELSGTCAGARMRVALEGEAMRVLTWVLVEFPGRVGLQLAITKQHGPSFLNAILGYGSLPTGDVMFDEAFSVRGHPAHDVQRLLWHQPFRAAVDDLGRAAVEFELGDSHLFVRYLSPLATEQELHRLLDRVGVVTTTFFKNAPGMQGPYR